MNDTFTDNQLHVFLYLWLLFFNTSLSHLIAFDLDEQVIVAMSL